MPTSHLRSTLCLALALCCACSPSEPEQAAPAPQAGASATTTEDTSAPAPSVGWTATLDAIQQAHGGSGVTVRGPGDDAAKPLKPGETVPRGATLKTDASSRARLTLSDGGHLTLNHSTTLTLVEGQARSANLSTGEALFDLPPQEGAPHAQVQTPHGALELLGTKVSVVASSQESLATVTQGAVQAAGSAGGAKASPGQELTLRGEDVPAQVTRITALGEALGWADIGAGEVSVSRGLGQLFAQTPGGGTPKPLEVTRRDVDVSITGVMAYTEITETFRNDTGRTLEGVYRFPLPADAQISRLRLLVDGDWQEGVFVANAKAERIWKQVIRDWRDPAWLRWQHGSQFELRIFPIEPHSSRTVTIGYTQRLASVADGRRYVYPMPVDAEGAQRVGRFDFEARVAGAAPQGHVLVEGYPATTARDGEASVVTFQAEDFAAAGDLGLRFSLAGGEATLRAASYQPDGDEDAYVMFAIRPDLSAATTTVGARDLVIIADTSYGRRGKTAELQAQLTARLIRELDPLDRALVLSCATTCAPVGATALTPPSLERAAQIAAQLDAAQARGTSNPTEALQVAAAVLAARPEAERTRAGRVIFLTDGVASSGPTRPDALAQVARATLGPVEARLTLVDFGAGSDALALDALAQAGAGSTLTLEPGASIGAQALNILGRQYGATLSDLSLTLPEGVTEVFPREIPPLADGDELLLIGRLEGESVAGEIHLSGRLSGEPWEARLPVQMTAQRSSANAFIPRLWAEQRIRELELIGGDPEAIIALSTRHGLLSRHTSLIALESDAMRREFGLRRNRTADDWTGTEAPVEITSDEDADAMGSADFGNLGTLGSLEGAGGSNYGISASGAGSSGGGMGSGKAIPDLGEKPSRVVPRFKPGRPRVSGSMDSRIIRRVIRRRHGHFRKCLERELMRDPTIKGRITMQFTISPTGHVIQVNPRKNTIFGSPGDRVARCITGVIKRLRFPAPKGGGIVKVIYPFVFDNDGSGRARWADPKPRRSGKPASIEPATLKQGRFDKRISRLEEAITSDPDDPRHRKRLVRTYTRAGRLDDARETVTTWLERNPMDTEALLLSSEVHALQGQLTAALDDLLAATEAAPAAEWIQERAVGAFAAQGQHALACYQRIAAKGRDASGDEPLACPIASDMSWLEGHVAAPAATPASGNDPVKKRKRSIFAELSWQGDADFDLLLMDDATGRVFSWMTDQPGLNVQSVRGQGPERLRFDRLHERDYHLVIVRRDDGSDPVPVTLDVSTLGVDASHPVTMTERRLRALTIDIKDKD